MCSLKVIVLFAVIAGCLAEPSRRRLNFRAFARQEAAEPAANEGYNYQAPAERLRLPIKFRQFSRQEEAPSSGYSYPKPTEGYGPPTEGETEEPSTEYGAPVTDSSNDSGDDTTTDNPQSETLRSLQASQFRRKNAKLTRSRSQPLKQAVQLEHQVQPVFYVQYPAQELVQPQYVYVFK